MRTRARSLLAITTLAALAAASLLGAQQRQNFDDVKLDVLPVQGNVYMLVGAGGNITIQVGKEGVLIVDTQFEPLAPRIMAEIRKLSTGPVRFIINTHVHGDHVGGNEALARLVPLDFLQPLNVIAHENVLNRLTAAMPPPQPGAPAATEQLRGLPLDEYYTPTKDMHFNGEAIILYHEPKAHTDGDSVVQFRGSDVVATGDVFAPAGYPFIDLATGGSLQGVIAGLNHILQLTVPAHTQEAGTYVIPGHGRLSDEADVVEYRDMVVIVRDRIVDMMKKKMTLDAIKAARPTRDYDAEYVSPTSFVTADAFVEAAYKSLTPPPPPPPARGSQGRGPSR